MADLFKCQVRQLAQELKIPRGVIIKPPTAGLWQGQTDEGEMGITYKALDEILDKFCGNKQVPDSGEFNKIKKMYKRSEHKRKGAEICHIN
jgi:NAD+ synthase